MNDNQEIIEIGIDSIVKKEENKKIDIEKGFRYLNPFFLVISSILSLIFIFQVYNGLFTLGENIDIENFTYKYSNYKEGGNIFGIFTSIFLHGGIDHIIGNILFLYILSLVIYRIFYFRKSIFLFLILGIIAGIPGYFLNDLPSFGASGAIFGLFGVATIFYFLNKNNLEDNLLDTSWVLLFLIGYQIFLGFTDSFVDNSAHISGYLLGLLIGYFLLKNKNILNEKL